MTTEHSSKVSLDTTVKLTGRRDWPQWYSTLQYLARAKDVWKYINPDEEGSNEILKPEELPTPEVFIKKRNYQLQKDYEKRLKTWTARHEAPETNTQDDTVSQVPSGERPSPPDLEASRYKKEPVGAGERAGQEIITKSIKMLSGANLPTDLWVEAVKAAAYLYNISPRKRNGWKSPCQTEDEWFRQYSRWWTPELILDHTRDLRPHWGWIYAYGCRAYPLKSDRERGIHKRTFKVEPRGHVGYLVGYVLNAHNLYRIWVPSLGQVIITRNVTFDENRFYSPDDVDAEPKTSTATQIVEEIRETESSLNPILEALGVIDSAEQTLIQATQPPPAVLEPNQEATRDVVPTEETGQEKDEGWLLTPDPTPEPESVPDSGGPTSETGDSSTTPLLEPSTERDTAAAVSDAEDVIYVRTEEDEGASTDIRSGNDLQPRPIMANQYDKVEEHETYLQKTETEKGTPHEDDMYTNSTRLSCLISRKPRKKRTTDTRLCTTSFRVLFTARSILA
nr:reverse transcriptase domain protein [Colletotrichum truncatum]KAF6781092.1 reverse transcriptase domain protein [Colletotrichum truncatum]